MDTLFNSTEKNPRGIPAAPFVEKVEDFLKDPADFEMVFAKFQERLSKYKFMQESSMSTIRQLQVRIPDIQHTLKICETLKDKKSQELEMHYQLNDTLYTKAIVEPSEDQKVGLWLGADVMLEYPVDEAIELLTDRLADSQRSLDLSNEDAEFLRENITTMEVNCARLYNWDVQKRQELKKLNKSTEKLAI